jgi:hypothetical protein
MCSNLLIVDQQIQFYKFVIGIENHHFPSIYFFDLFENPTIILFPQIY